MNHCTNSACRLEGKTDKEVTILPSLGHVLSRAEGRNEKLKGKLALIGRSNGELHRSGFDNSLSFTTTGVS